MRLVACLSVYLSVMCVSVRAPTFDSLDRKTSLLDVKVHLENI